MSNRQFLRLAAITVCAFFVQNTTVLAQRARNTHIHNAEYTAQGNIGGVVTDGKNPMKGVTVKLSSEVKVIMAVETGEDGKYSFRDLRPGTYDITIFKAGYRKRIIQRVPVVESFLTHNDAELCKLNNWHEERNPTVDLYEKLDTKKLEKMQ